MAKNKKQSYDAIVMAILYIVIGILFIAFRSSLLDWMLTVSGILAIAYGIYQIIKKNLVPGIIFVVVGILLILGGWLFLEIALIIFGVLLIVYGAKELVMLLQAKGKTPIFPLLVSCLAIVAGILLVVSKWAFFDWFFIVIGVILIIDGILALIKK